MKWLDSFHLSDTERKGFTVLTILLVLLILVRVSILFLPEKRPPVVQIQEEFQEWQRERKEAMRVSRAFDPNTVSDSIIQSYKISPFAAKNWIAFRQRGNRFVQPQDLLDVYGMDSVWFEINRDSIHIDIEEKSTKKPIEFKRFPFDPNTVNRDQMLALGFPEWLAERIINYRMKGGTFKKPDDLKRIYDFPEDLYERIGPLIRIDVSTGEHEEIDITVPIKVELNSSDSIALIQVKGIGPVFAHRILEHRRKLGGFYNLDQLLEVYGITQERLESLKDQLSVNGDLVMKLNINQASFKALVGHPYLNYEQVKQIVNYREKMGSFKAVDELVNLPHFKTEDLVRLKFYLIVE